MMEEGPAYRIVLRNGHGGQRVVYARQIRVGPGFVEAFGPLRGPALPSVAVRIPGDAILYIEAGPLRPFVVRGWIRPRTGVPSEKESSRAPANAWAGGNPSERKFRRSVYGRRVSLEDSSGRARRRGRPLPPE
jgi:hypothetical protein